MKIKFYAMLLSVLLTGCAQATYPVDIIGQRAPSNDQAEIRNTHYHGIIGKYNHREPVDPRPWRKLNKEQTPKNGEGS